MKFLNYNCLKHYVDFKIDLPLEVAEYIGKDLRELLKKSSIKNPLDNIKINHAYLKMEKITALLFLQDEKISKLYLKNDVDDDFKKTFIESFQTFDIKKIKTGSKIFVKANFLNLFLENIFPRIKKKFYLYTGASDYEVSNIYSKYINNVKIIKWIGHNISMDHDKVVKIPIGLPENKLLDHSEFLTNIIKISDTNKSSNLLITYMENTNSKREKINKQFENKDWVFFAPKLEYEDYMKTLQSHNFVLCPEGNGLDTHRFWETVYVGSIPVVESGPLNDLYKKVNCIIVDSFDNLTEESLKNFVYNDSLMGRESLYMNTYDSNIS